MIDTQWMKKLFWWTLFAASFGYVEALVVVYIRRLTGMAPSLDYQQVWAMRHLAWNGPAIIAEMSRLGVYETEKTREAATLLLLLGPACAAGRTGRERLGLFLFTFAVWDETYYLWLKLWTGFPHSLASSDIYFLLPIAWYGPVWFPVLIVMPLLIGLSLRLIRCSFRTASAALPRPEPEEGRPGAGNKEGQESKQGPLFAQ